MKILITGIAGFIGSQLAKHLVHDGHTVTGIDNLDCGYEEDIPEECEWAMIDLIYLDRWIKDGAMSTGAGSSTDAVLGDVDLVIHCAANLEVMLSLASPTSDLRGNTEGTIQVLEMMKLRGIKNIINFSSACVYGRGAKVMQPVTEEEALLCRPHWPYGASKLAAEVYCNLYVQTCGFNVINMRPGIVCGPREWYGRALTIFLKRALEGKAIVVFTDPLPPALKPLEAGYDNTPKRDFVHINDVIGQTRACLTEYPARFYGSKTYNMGSNRQLSIMQLARKVGETLDAEVITETVAQGAQSKRVPGRIRIPGEMKGMRLDMVKAKRDLGHVPMGSMAKIIDDEVTWLKGGGLRRWQSAVMKV